MYQRYVSPKSSASDGDTYLRYMSPTAHPPRSRISAAGNRRDSGASMDPSDTV